MPSNSGFDLALAAESLRDDVRRLARINATMHPHEAEDNAAELRRRIAKTAKQIAFETAPRMDVVKDDWIVLGSVAAWNIFIDWRAFDRIPLDGYISISDLARLLNAQESLPEYPPSSSPPANSSPAPSPTLTHSRISPFYIGTNPLSDTCIVAVGNAMKPFSQWPEYFRAYGRREPVGPGFTPFSFGWGHAPLPPWEVKVLYPLYASAFMRTMRSKQIAGGDMVLTGEEALCDLEWVGIEALTMDENAAVVVDVGGGLGQLIHLVLRDVVGLLPRQCVLQDRREVIEEARAELMRHGLDEVVVMEHDFHHEQPIKGALVYLLRRILCDYSDEMATGILRRLAEALPADKPNARVIIIEERLLEVPTPENCIVDLVMMNLGGMLRNYDKYREIVAAAGLTVVGYHIQDGNPICAVECVKIEGAA
ncbi:S-adenosyl-L-methionine-dependent methyltransferase [Parathielavia appendiculata]|uniref:S-adenosyl-L-methionine-dependent methyltransferase n=1 Tax=Parathielavia appendiculata TaxID=2587402 RepID=A0AAN6YYB2_9PEZI|nr:S-adenosyl-L-methionine-dependent methyltransferase [Parathielavia appendiculata]